MFRFIYRSLVRLHPAGFRRRFSEEMLSIFDQAEETRGAAKLVADAFISFCRQWVLRSQYWKEKETEPLRFSVDGVPVFYTLQSFAPRTSALINGGVVTLLMFCAVCLALKYNWTHPVHVHFSDIPFGIRSEDRPPVISATFPPEGRSLLTDRPKGLEPRTAEPDAQLEPSTSVQPLPDSPVSSQFQPAAVPANIQPQATSVTKVRSYSRTQIAARKTGPVQSENQFAAEVALGRFYFLHGRYAEAVAHYRLALQIRPNDPDATFGLAQALEKSGRTAEAQSSYRAYLKAAPNGHFAEQSKAVLHRFEQSASR